MEIHQTQIYDTYGAVSGGIGSGTYNRMAHTLLQNRSYAALYAGLQAPRTAEHIYKRRDNHYCSAHVVRTNAVRCTDRLRADEKVPVKSLEQHSISYTVHHFTYPRRLVCKGSRSPRLSASPAQGPVLHAVYGNGSYLPQRTGGKAAESKSSASDDCPSSDKYRKSVLYAQ